MDKLNFTWVEKKAQYQTGEALYLNRIKLGAFYWNSSRSKSDEQDDSNNWVGELALPSLSGKSKRVFGSNPDEVKMKMEQITIEWFTEATKSTTPQQAEGYPAEEKGSPVKNV